MGIKSANAAMTKLEQNSGVKYVEFNSVREVFLDQKVNGNKRYLRRLVEQRPYGIKIVLQDMDFLESKFAGVPPGSSKVCGVDTGYDNTN